MTKDLRSALESALVADPDDLATHMAYADYLSDQGDPRGEFIRVQLAREQAEVARRGRDCLEDARTNCGASTVCPGSADWRRINSATLGCRSMSPAVAAGSTRSTCTICSRPWPRLWRRRLLSQLRILDLDAEIPWHDRAPWDVYGEEEPEFPANHSLEPLAGTENLGNVRTLVVGGSDRILYHPERIEEVDPPYFYLVSGVGVVEMIERMPHLEELRLLACGLDTSRLFAHRGFESLRILQVYNSSYYPLALLRDNPSLGRLTHLLLQPRKLYPGEQAHIQFVDVRLLLRSTHLPSLTHLSIRLSDMGDEGVKEIIDSGILARLKVLDLRYGQITNRGAERFASCPDTKQLERLVLSNNDLTETGVKTLRSAGVNVVAEELGRGTDLFEYDME